MTLTIRDIGHFLHAKNNNDSISDISAATLNRVFLSATAIFEIDQPST